MLAVNHISHNNKSIVKAIYFLPIASFLILFTLGSTPAQPTHFLCEQRDLLTILALRTID